MVKLVVGIVCRSMLVETAAAGGGEESSFSPPGTPCVVDDILLLSYIHIDYLQEVMRFKSE